MNNEKKNKNRLIAITILLLVLFVFSVIKTYLNTEEIKTKINDEISNIQLYINKTINETKERYYNLGYKQAQRDLQQQLINQYNKNEYITLNFPVLNESNNNTIYKKFYFKMIE